MPKEYDEIRLRYWRVGVDRYFVLANGKACVSEMIDVPEGHQYHKQLNELLDEEFLKRPPGRGSVRQRLRDLGTEVTERLLPKRLRSCLEKCFEASASQGRGLRLRFELPPELSTIPIELLKSPAIFLAAHQEISVVRSVAPEVFGTSCQFVSGKASLTVVLAGASPTSYLNIGKSISGEFKSIRKVLPKGIRVPIILNASRKTIGDTIAKTSGDYVVVISAHGEYDDHAEEGFVILQDEEGKAERVGEELLAGLLAGPRVRLVVLNLCKGAKSNLYDPFSGLAGRLTAYGVPMVVSYQHGVTDRAACRFSPELFESLAKKCWLDEACAVARSRIGDFGETTIEWCTPVVYLVQQCYYTQLIGQRNQQSFRFPPERGWDVCRKDAAEGLRRNPGDSDLLALDREAWIEVELAPAIAAVCNDLNAARPVAKALSRINNLTFPAERGLLQPLNRFAGYDPGDEEQLLNRLTVKVKNEAGWFLLHGEPGTGKSRFADLIRKELIRQGYRVMAVRCAGLTALEIQAALAKQAGKPQSIKDYALRFANVGDWTIQQSEDLKRSLQVEKAILILDDVSAEDIARFLPESPASVIITSRRRRFDSITGDRSIEVIPFTGEQANRLLTRTIAESKYSGDPVTTTQAWQILTERVDGSPEVLALAAKVFDDSSTSADIVSRLLSFDTKKAQSRWAAAIKHLPEDCKQLLIAFAVCARPGTGLGFAGEVAGIKDQERLRDARRKLEDAGLLRCVGVYRQYFRIHPLLRKTIEKTEGWQAACVRHLSILMSKIERAGAWNEPAGACQSDWLGEVGVAVRRHLDHDRHNPTPVLIHKAVDQLVECALVCGVVVEESYEEQTFWMERQHYLQGRLLQLAGRLLQARRYQQNDINAETVKVSWVTKPLDRDLHFLEVRRLLKRQAKDFWREKDWPGFSNNCEIRAWVLDRSGNGNSSRRLLRLCAKQMKEHSVDKPFYEDGSEPSWVWWRVDAEWISDEEQSRSVRELLRNWPRSFSINAPLTTGQPLKENAEEFRSPAIDATDTTDPFTGTAKVEMTEDMKIALAEDALALLREEKRRYQEPQQLCACYANCVVVLQFCSRHREAAEILDRLSPLCRQLGDLHLLRECYEGHGIALGILGWIEQAERMFALGRTIDMALRFEEALAYVHWNFGVIAAIAERNPDAAEYLDEAASRMEAVLRAQEHSKVREDIDRVRRKRVASVVSVE